MRQVSGVRGAKESVSAPANKIVAVTPITHLAVIFHGDAKGRGRRTMAYNIGGEWWYDPNSEEFCGRILEVPAEMVDQLNQMAGGADGSSTQASSVQVPKDNVEVA